MKRTFDFLISFLGLVFFSPILLIVLFLIWVNDFSNPFYVSNRVGLNGSTFKIYKLRSMIKNADSTGVDSTSENDPRITFIGGYIRKFKLDEISQLLNVLKGDMSLVGPRPNVQREVDMYTLEEKTLLTMKPGITDFSSIVFSDEGHILKDFDDPDIAYNQLIRPGKAELGVFYIKNHSLLCDIKIIYYTALSIVNRKKALQSISRLLNRMGASNQLVALSMREEPLIPRPPLGSQDLVTSRKNLYK